MKGYHLRWHKNRILNASIYIFNSKGLIWHLYNRNFRMDKRLLYIIALTICIATGCSSQKNTFINRLYHNTTARFNAYYRAKEKIDELEGNIQKDYQEDFSQVLLVFYPIYSATIEANEAFIDEARELAYKAID